MKYFLIFMVLLLGCNKSLQTRSLSTDSLPFYNSKGAYVGYLNPHNQQDSAYIAKENLYTLTALPKTTAAANNANFDSTVTVHNVVEFTGSADKYFSVMSTIGIIQIVALGLGLLIVLGSAVMR